jgi:hypothetical protein
MVAAAAADAYLMRLRLPLETVAAELAQDLRAHGAKVARTGADLTVRWPRSDADDVDQWHEHSFPELVFFLRAWAGDDPDRRPQVLEDRPLPALR